MIAKTAAWVPAVAIALLLSELPAVAQGGGNNCTISTTSVAFGAYDVFGAGAVNSTGAITFRCGGAARDINVSLSAGQSGTYVARSLMQSAEVLSYNLYMDAACTTVWGDGTGGTQTYFDADPPNNTDVVLTIYGRIPGSQDVSAGAYTDTVIATINF